MSTERAIGVVVGACMIVAGIFIAFGPMAGGIAVILLGAAIFSHASKMK